MKLKKLRLGHGKIINFALFCIYSASHRVVRFVLMCILLGFRSCVHENRFNFEALNIAAMEERDVTRFFFSAQALTNRTSSPFLSMKMKKLRLGPSKIKNFGLLCIYSASHRVVRFVLMCILLGFRKCVHETGSIFKRLTLRLWRHVTSHASFLSRFFFSAFPCSAGNWYRLAWNNL